MQGVERMAVQEHLIDNIRYVKVGRVAAQLFISVHKGLG